jgi:hypothetical protein
VRIRKDESKISSPELAVQPLVMNHVRIPASTGVGQVHGVPKGESKTRLVMSDFERSRTASRCSQQRTTQALISRGPRAGRQRAPLTSAGPRTASATSRRSRTPSARLRRGRQSSAASSRSSAPSARQSPRARGSSPSPARRLQVPARERAASLQIVRAVTAVSPHISGPSRFGERRRSARTSRSPSRALAAQRGRRDGSRRRGGAESPLFWRQRFTSHLGAAARLSAARARLAR